MIYQVNARLFFVSEDEAKDFYHDCEVAFPKSTSVNPDSDERELGIIELLENNHDQDPNSPCLLVKRLIDTT